MSKFKAGSYCSIQSFVSQEDPELAEILEKTCTLDLLERAPRRAPGLTFLMPDAKHEVRKECIKLIESTEPKNLRLAADIMQSMIIRDFLPTAASWTKKEDIPNSMFPAKRIEGVATTSDGVTIKGENGTATLKKNTVYRDASKRENMAVWTLVSGVPSRSTAEATLSLKKMPLKKGEKGKFGGYMPSNEEIAKLRFRIGIVAENEYANDIMQGKMSGCIAHYAAGLVKFMKESHHDMYMNIIPLLQFDESDFYILVEPHLPGGQSPVVPDYIIEEWWAKSSGTKFANYASYRAEVFNDLSSAMPNRTEVQDKVGSIEGANDPSSVKEFYAKVCLENKVNGVEIYTSYLANYYRGNHNLRILHDELRFALPVQFREAKDLESFKDVIQWIGERMHNPEKSSLFSKSGASPLLNAFVNSSAFLFVPLSEDEMQNRRKATSNLQTAIDKKYFFAGDYESFTRHTRIAEGERVTKFNDIMNAVCSGTLSEDQKSELVKFITGH